MAGASLLRAHGGLGGPGTAPAPGPRLRLRLRLWLQLQLTERVEGGEFNGHLRMPREPAQLRQLRLLDGPADANPREVIDDHRGFRETLACDDGTVEMTECCG